MTWSSPDNRAIIHVDVDAFFASCEQALHPEYQGKPVVTGKERGIAASMSYEAKRKGVTRGMILRDIKKVCPDAIIVPSDYETYSLFSKRMFAIMRRFTNIVEEYSIDEGFADVTGLRRPMNMSYPAMARKMKEQIELALGITVSVGLAPTKVLAKLGSKWDKPDGFTYISARKREEYLKKLEPVKIWGIGPNTANYMRQLGIKTVLEFVKKPFEYVEEHFTKPHQEIWRELNGESVYPVTTEEKTSYASISKTKTFTPPSTEKEFVCSQLVKNLENACIKARRYDLVANRLCIFLKQQDFASFGLEAELSRASAYPNDLLNVVRGMFADLFQEKTLYRSTGVVLCDLQENTNIQTSLFESPVLLNRLKRVYDAVDKVSERFGKHTVHLGASLKANAFGQHLGERGDKPARQVVRLKGERGRQRLRVPMLSS
ncbi:MAG: DNA polymerase IV [Candidatus Magasanikbacteria bacterium RIFCSPHIGHO2_02_FULL_51_14]|uniref:DNA polymerase IV n=1 Tax=Candidatus Magasanikbacteria bacterium RIFCSPHIGHO2_02_FULL_51_14 TaxID=1798683 RepID=A0A1F6MF51_9BACT|nr:MAG: DNA polymerase IV [Candidatus Magasanikbacteria bacterium RIFCSPHIGHO2_02_FULL_51_14]